MSEELSDDAADEGARDEHRGEHQPDGDDGAGDLLHGADGGVAWCHAVLDVVLDGLDDDEASSTTIPMARTSPKRVRLLSEKPMTAMTAKVPMMATGTATRG